MIEWYICPYDTNIHPGKGIVRVPAMHRYIPSVPNSDGSNWDEAEILGNHIVVKVGAPVTVHTAIQADADFMLVPTGEVSIRTSLRSKVESKLLALGYSQAEIDSTSWNARSLLDLLTIATSVVSRNAARSAHVVSPTRRGAGKTISDINRRLPS